jgi:2-phospho-L-lactate guanylyltransferase
MTLALVVPVKGFAAGKGRLAEALSASDRTQLNRMLLERMLTVARDFSRADFRIVVSPDEAVLATARAQGVVGLPEASPGLNGALQDAANDAAGSGAVEFLVVSVDLPRLEPADLDAMVGEGGVAIAPDRSGTGTNALYLPRPGLFPFQYGPASFAAHVAAARAAGVEPRIIRRPGLAFDIDTPEDYREWLASTPDRG